ncbi:response regulator transcription factor [Thiospirochaeta perfilievii]|uniref:Response regulator transcription factor n=1 Tax=Thiospirochaeta perfilievii TaxID=252967 RepID=A0A5C1QB10_9SPIO|nr:response regulator transcription factor [Thiospirochaeta perfilievii]QEN05313.1 response regulator transcription factor [Thiospirochaeta perfilievii]
MDCIKIGFYSEHNLIQEGISTLLESIQDFHVLIKYNNMDKLIEDTDLKQIHILLLHLQVLDKTVMNVISRLSNKYPKLQLLILSAEKDEGNILNTIKAGAKGFLAKDSKRKDLLEAIYTLRSGHDYYSKSITQLLLNKYITNIKSDESCTENQGIKCLSSRELEVLKLWGNSYTNSEISEELFISVRTVESHKNHIMQKLNMKTSVDLVKFAIRNNIVDY